MGRGITHQNAKSSHAGQTRSVLYVTVSRSQVRELRQAVTQVDANAFVVIGQGQAADGEGFRQLPRT